MDRHFILQNSMGRSRKISDVLGDPRATSSHQEPVSPRTRRAASAADTLIYDICGVLNIEIYVVPTQPLGISGSKQASHILRGNPRGVWPARRDPGPRGKWARGVTG